MDEVNGLKSLRAKLVNRRRSLVTAFEAVPEDHLTGDAFRRLQQAIEAIDRAIDEEEHRDVGTAAHRAPGRSDLGDGRISVVP